MAYTLRVTPWEYSAIRKNAADKTEGEFISWMLESYPFLRAHLYEQIDLVVDYKNGDATATWNTLEFSKYILSFRSLQ